MEAIESGSEVRRYVRIQVVGKHGVGKSSLVRRLLGEGIDDIKSTDGIDILKKCQIRRSDGEWFVSKSMLSYLILISYSQTHLTTICRLVSLSRMRIYIHI